MTHEIIMPKLGETMEEGYLISWKKNVGDKVQKGEVLFEVMSDKTNFEVEASESGYLRQILFQPSDQPIPVTTVIAYLTDTPEEPVEEKKEAVSARPEIPAPEPPTARNTEPAAPPAERIRISPRARKLALEKGVEISAITGSGPEGRIEEKDVLNYLQARQAATASYQVHPWSPIRKIAAERLSLSKKTIPHYYLQGSIVMDQIARLKEELKKAQKDYTYTDFLIFYCSRVIREFPLLNAALVDQEIRLYPSVNIGLAVALEDGLVVPVLKAVDTMSLEQIASQVKSLTPRARNNQLKKEETEEARFVISNLGMYQVENFQPIINPPGVAIMGVGAITPRVMVSEQGSATAISLVMKISLSLDHRVIDGAYAGRFFFRLKTVLQQPGLLAV